MIAVVDKADKEVVPEFGVPLSPCHQDVSLPIQHRNQGSYGPMSDGVTGSEGGGGRLISVGVVMMGIVSAV